MRRVQRRLSDSLFVVFAVTVTQNGLPQRALPLCLTVRETLFRTCPPVDGRKEEMNTSPA